MKPSNVQTFRLGLIGYPLSHSLSPAIHAAALRACGLEGDYSLFPILPDDKQSLTDILSRLRSGKLNGLNVTIPYKQSVIEFLDELTPVAQAISAVNTIYCRENKLIGDNTDASGFLTDLKRTIDISSFILHPSSLIFGAGGSARAIVYALLKDGWKVTVAARRLEQAESLASNYKNVMATEPNLQIFQLSNVHLVVNTTPLGMYPVIDQSPLPEILSLPSHVFVYDLIYNPRETKFVRDARSQGLNARTGLGMLIEQAALSFEIWTCHNPPRDALWNAIENGSLVTGR